MREDHPYEQLAAYVEGSATDQEQETVQAHLADCSECRADVEYARQARAALASLPDLEAPGLANHGFEWLREAATVLDLRPGGPPPRGRRAGRVRAGRRQENWQRLAWGAGIAAAAAVAAVVVFSGLNGTSHRAATGGAGVPAAAPEFGAAATNAFRSATNYNPASLNALARSLAAGRSTDQASQPLASPVPAAGGTAKALTTQLDPASAQRAISCLQQGAGLPGTASPSYLEAAEFEGKPAYVGAFRNNPVGGSPNQLLVIAVDQTSCQPLYLVTQPL